MIELKIGRHRYEVTADDVFMDNGNCLQLLTQSKENSSFGKRAHPLLSKRTANEIDKFEKKQREHTYGNNVQIFNLVNV